MSWYIPIDRASGKPLRVDISDLGEKTGVRTKLHEDLPVIAESEDAVWAVLEAAFGKSEWLYGLGQSRRERGGRFAIVPARAPMETYYDGEVREVKRG